MANLKKRRDRTLLSPAVNQESETNAVLYMRSSKDRNEVSIDAQFRLLHEFAAEKNLVVVGTYQDVVISGKTIEHRPDFQRLINDITNPARGWKFILALDTARVSRSVADATWFDNECRRNGVEPLYKMMPLAEQKSATATFTKGMFFNFDQYHSAVSKEKGLAGMEQNVIAGWRAGGRAPRGYKLVWHETGGVRNGAKVKKSKLAIDTDLAPAIQLYLKARAAGEARAECAQRLGLPFPITSLVGMEWQALTYAGHTVWNMHNEFHKGRGYAMGEKRRPREQWKICYHTHSALITDEEAEHLLDQLELRRQRTWRQNKKSYLLTGLLCTPDGTTYTGEWDKKNDAPVYRVGAKGRRISGRRVEAALLTTLKMHLTGEPFIKRMLELVKLRIDKGMKAARDIDITRARITKLQAQIDSLIIKVADCDGDIVEQFYRKIAELETERKALVDDIEKSENAAKERGKMEELTADAVCKYMDDVVNLLSSHQEGGNIDAMKAMLFAMIDRIELDPETERYDVFVKMNLPESTEQAEVGVASGGITPVLGPNKNPVPGALPDTGVKMASPRGFEPRYSP